MKYLITSLILFLSCINLQAQTFSFYRISPEVIYTNDTFGIVSYGKVNNLTGSNNQIRLIRTVVNVPQGWQTCICDIVQCHPQGIDTAIGNYPPGLSTIAVIFYTHPISGTGYVTIRAEKVSNTNENYNVTFGGAYNPIGIHQISSVVKEFNLGQNYPNPFNPATNIKFSLSKDGNVSLKVYDMLGNEVASFVDGFLKAGVYNAEFDGANFSSGVYLYKLVSKDFVDTKKMVLIK